MTVSSFLEMTKTNKARLLIIITLANDRDPGRQQCEKGRLSRAQQDPFLGKAIKMTVKNTREDTVSPVTKNFKVLQIACNPNKVL